MALDNKPLIGTPLPELPVKGMVKNGNGHGKINQTPDAVHHPEVIPDTPEGKQRNQATDYVSHAPPAQHNQVFAENNPEPGIKITEFVIVWGIKPNGALQFRKKKTGMPNLHGQARLIDGKIYLMDSRLQDSGLQVNDF